MATPGAQCGDPTAISAGYYHSCALLPEGRVKCWGRNDSGELGLGDQQTRGFGPNHMGDNLPAVDLGTGVKAIGIAAGTFHTCALLSNEKVKCWGGNGSGQLGLGDKNARGTGPNQMGDKLLAVDLGTGVTAKAIAAGYSHTCALLSDGAIKCWGSGLLLGLGTTEDHGSAPNEMGNNLPAVDLGTGVTATAITVGEIHTCALLSDGRVKCWGGNGVGQLGLGDQQDRGHQPNQMGDKLPAVNLGAGLKAKAISAGHAHTCALLSDDTVKCWGINDAGQLGLDDAQNRGDGLNEMGDDLPTVNLGVGVKPSAIVGGYKHTCALLTNGKVKCWGKNDDGQLGLGDTQTRGDGPNEMGNLPSVDLGTSVETSSVTAGFAHTCVLLVGGHLKCWGNNYKGQLGLDDPSYRGNAVNQMGNNLPPVDL